MCGITLYYNKGNVENKIFLNRFKKSFISSQRRGSDSCGIAISVIKNNRRDITLFKMSDSPKEMLSSKDYKNYVSSIDGVIEFAVSHSRMNTNGNSYLDENNQPLIKENDFLFFNGIITNFNELKHDQNLNDGFLLFDNYENKELKGIINLFYFNIKNNKVIVKSNNKNIFFVDSNGILEFSSEPQFLCNSNGFSIVENNKEINLRELETHQFIKIIKSKSAPVVVGEVNYAYSDKGFLKDFEIIKNSYKGIKRCSVCILPESHPFITFNEKGVCNFCINHKQVIQKPKGEFKNIIDDVTINGGDILLGLSGGRDSSLALHKMVSEYGLKPITYTYDWGLNTDLSRRNVSRLCGELGVENILISADIRQKRNNVRKNLKAWFKRPHLGVIPLLMAGDKQFISNAALLKKERNISLEMFAFNLHEKTQFKEEYSGVKMWSDGNTTYGEDLELLRQIKLISFYGKEALLNLSLLNSSVLDSLKGFFNYYHSNVNVCQFFEYHVWNEESLNNTLRSSYQWEFANDTSTSWRIGDGTASFYNLAYFIQSGFTENDVIRSNLIRDGQLSRDEALEKVMIENNPRLPTLDWYCRVLNLDTNDICKKLINTFDFKNKPY